MPFVSVNPMARNPGNALGCQTCSVCVDGTIRTLVHDRRCEHACTSFHPFPERFSVDLACLRQEFEVGRCADGFPQLPEGVVEVRSSTANEYPSLL
jgi:hypothetical protein